MLPPDDVESASSSSTRLLKLGNTSSMIYLSGPKNDRCVNCPHGSCMTRMRDRSHCRFDFGIVTERNAGQLAKYENDRSPRRTSSLQKYQLSLVSIGKNTSLGMLGLDVGSISRKYDLPSDTSREAHRWWCATIAFKASRTGILGG